MPARKPRPFRRGPAAAFEAPNERIYEFEGGLVSIRRDDAGRLILEAYRLDPDVIVRAPRSNLDLPEV